MIAQGEVWWAALPQPVGSAPGYTRPVVVVQGDAFNQSRIDTVVVVPLTTNTRWSTAPGTVTLDSASTGLPRDSVANGAHIVTIDRSVLLERVGRLPDQKLDLVLYGIDVVLGR